MTFWASIYSPWAHLVEPGRFGQALENIRRMAPKMIPSGHLSPAEGRTEQFLELLATVPASVPSLAPDQSALEQIRAQM